MERCGCAVLSRPQRNARRCRCRWDNDVNIGGGFTLGIAESSTQDAGNQWKISGHTPTHTHTPASQVAQLMSKSTVRCASQAQANKFNRAERGPKVLAPLGCTHMTAMTDLMRRYGRACLERKHSDQ